MEIYSRWFAGVVLQYGEYNLESVTGKAWRFHRASTFSTQISKDSEAIANSPHMSF
jgi:hypothetical protein